MKFLRQPVMKLFFAYLAILSLGFQGMVLASEDPEATVDSPVVACLGEDKTISGTVAPGDDENLNYSWECTTATLIGTDPTPDGTDPFPVSKTFNSSTIGIHDVTLTASNNAGDHTATAKVAVVQVESITGISDGDTVGANLDVELTAVLTGGASLPAGSTVTWGGDAEFSGASGLTVNARFTTTGTGKEITAKVGTQSPPASVSSIEVVEDSATVDVALDGTDLKATLTYKLWNYDASNPIVTGTGGTVQLQAIDDLDDSDGASLEDKISYSFTNGVEETQVYTLGGGAILAIYDTPAEGDPIALMVPEDGDLGITFHSLLNRKNSSDYCLAVEPVTTTLTVAAVVKWVAITVGAAAVATTVAVATGATGGATLLPDIPITASWSSTGVSLSVTTTVGCTSVARWKWWVRDPFLSVNVAASPATLTVAGTNHPAETIGLLASSYPEIQAVAGYGPSHNRTVPDSETGRFYQNNPVGAATGAAWWYGPYKGVKVVDKNGNRTYFNPTVTPGYGELIPANTHAVSWPN